MFKYYFYGSYFFAFSEIVYRMTSDKKMFHCMTPVSTIYTLSYLILPPLVLPFHLLNQTVEFISKKV